MADLGEGLDNFENEVENLKNTKMKLFGITMTPTTIGALFALIGAIGGSLYGAFEVYKDYMDMKEIVQNIDVDVIENRNAQIEAQLNNTKTEISVQLASIQKQLDDQEKRAREQKVDLNDQINNLDDQVRRVEKLVRDTENEVRQIIQNAEERFDNKRDALQNQYDTKASSLRDTTDQKIKDVEDRLNAKLQRALDNPLAN
jgi:predicted  nucleic acid-binding Zn-ribbon protein